MRRTGRPSGRGCLGSRPSSPRPSGWTPRSPRSSPIHGRCTTTTVERVKADPFVQLRLLELQALDSALDRLAHRRRTLPELAEIEKLEAQVEALRDDTVRAETEVSDLARETKKF